MFRLNWLKADEHDCSNRSGMLKVLEFLQRSFNYSNLSSTHVPLAL